MGRKKEEEWDELVAKTLPGVVERARKEEAARNSPVFHATVSDVASLAEKAMNVHRRQYAELRATLTTREQRELLESVMQSQTMARFLLGLKLDLDGNPCLLDLPEGSQRKASLLEASLYLGQQPD